MALWTQGKGQVLGRRDSLRGVSYSYVRNGIEITAKWPRSRGKNLHPKTLEQMELFRQWQWMFKYSPAVIQRSYADAVRGTPLMPRDIFAMTQAGRAYFVIMPDGQRVFHMATVNGVSDSLDVFGQYPGTMLYRDELGWRLTGQPTAPGQVLVTQLSGKPEWQAMGGGGSVQAIEKIVLAADAPSFDFTAIPQSFETLQLVITGAGTRAASNMVALARFNGDSGNNYDRSLWNRFGTDLGAPSSYFQVGNFPAATVFPRSGMSVTSIGGYARTDFYKTAIGQSGVSISGATGGQFADVEQAIWRSTAAINQLTIFPDNDDWKAGSVATLYGIA